MTWVELISRLTEATVEGRAVWTRGDVAGSWVLSTPSGSIVVRAPAEGRRPRLEVRQIPRIAREAKVAELPTGALDGLVAAIARAEETARRGSTPSSPTWSRRDRPPRPKCPTPTTRLPQDLRP